MIDLFKLKSKFKLLFEEETEETFSKWLEEKQMSEILSSLGKGNFIEIPVDNITLGQRKCTLLPICIIASANNSPVGNTSYAMAA